MAMNTNIKSVLGDFLNAYDDFNTRHWEQVRSANMSQYQDLHEQYEFTLDKLQEEFANKILEVYINTLKQL